MVEVVARGSSLSNKTKSISLSNSPFTTLTGFPITDDLTTPPTITTTKIHHQPTPNNTTTISKQHQSSAKPLFLYRPTFDESETFYLISDDNVVCPPSDSIISAAADSLSSLFIPDIQENDASFNNSQSDDASSISTCIASSTQTDPLDYGQEDTVGNFTTVPAARTITTDDAFLDEKTSAQLMMLSTMGISPSVEDPCMTTTTATTTTTSIDTMDAVPTITTAAAAAATWVTNATKTDRRPVGGFPSLGYSRIEKLNVQEIAQRRIFEEATEDAFFVADLGAVVRQHRQWESLLPRVEPFYAVKCNSDPMILKTLYDLGAGFDCASRAEIDAVMSLGTLPEDIIYANPCKQASHIRHARDRGVYLMTFDNANELMKIKEIHPNAKVVLRVLTDDSRSKCRFGVKFGARPGTTLGLLQLARDLDVEVVGVSFHVGSGCFDKMAFVDAVKVARHVFDEGASLGMNFSLLDIGGGFPGLGTAGMISFPEIASVLGPAIDDYFPRGIRIIAEPGRYYASGTYTLCVSVTSRRVVLPHDKKSSSNPNNSIDISSIPASDESPLPQDDNTRPSYMYYVNDGIYGSFNCLLFDHAILTPKVLTSNGRLLIADSSTFVSTTMAAAADNINNHGGDTDMKKMMASMNNNRLDHFESSLWGPTCDSIDCISKKVYLPELQIGDWISFENMGAYTTAAASTFNGFARSTVVYTNTELSFY
jgi:ornithine decarboxylase